ncbi:MAG: YcgN family cysteine cluster protein [Verrucomicrobia bacterium]|nr:YcgN family cysteine cluster protein [Verrucomicrobiota bacterium]
MNDEQPFWQRKRLTEMTDAEWESLCDGCAKCCVHKLEDEDTGEIEYTNLACRLLDLHACRCSDYANRHTLVPACIRLKPDAIPYWMPETCAYRLVAEGQDLPDWHPLKTGDKESVHRAGISVRGCVISEAELTGGLEALES